MTPWCADTLADLDQLLKAIPCLKTGSCLKVESEQRSILLQ